MINDVIEVKWKELGGKIRGWRDKLSADQPTLDSSQHEEFIRNSSRTLWVHKRASRIRNKQTLFKS